MKLLIAAVTFAATLGMLFLIETDKPPKEDYAQIIEALKEENTNIVTSTTPTPVKTRTPTLPILSPTPLEKQNRGSSISQPSPSGSGETGTTPAPTYTPSRTPTPTPPSTGLPPSPTPSETPAPTTTPMPSPPPQEVGQGFINITSITSPVEQNSTAQLNISTLPDTQCSIKVTLPSGNQSSAKGLEAKTADASGNTTWSWKINWNTTPGTANIDITCSKDGQNFSKSLQMTIIER